MSKEGEGDFMVLEWVDDVHGVGIGGNKPLCVGVLNKDSVKTLHNLWCPT